MTIYTLSIILYILIIMLYVVVQLSNKFSKKKEQDAIAHAQIHAQILQDAMRRRLSLRQRVN